MKTSHICEKRYIWDGHLLTKREIEREIEERFDKKRNRKRNREREIEIESDLMRHSESILTYWEQARSQI